MRAAAVVAGFVLAVGVAGACAGVKAPPPPASPPALTADTTVAGPRITVAAKAARALYDFSYATRRFGQDSTWGYRSADKVAVRLTYSMPTHDSTRVQAEVWGPCDDRRGLCLRAFVHALWARMVQEEAPPG